MVEALAELEKRRETMSHDAFGDEICKIMDIPREMLDKAARTTPELRRQVFAGEIDFEEAYRRSQN